MPISDVITIVKDIFVGLSTLGAVIIAFLGLSAWRKELKGKSEYQLAKEVLKSVYKVRDAFNHVRNPGIFQFEYPEEMIGLNGHLKEEFNYKGMLHVYEKRWEFMTKAFNELEEKNLEAQVEWGPEFQDVILKLRSCKVDLHISIQEMLDRIKNPSDYEQIDPQTNRERRSVLYYHSPNSKYDKFTPKIYEAIIEFEKWLRPHIKR